MAADTDAPAGDPPAPPTIDNTTQLPDTHPLVTAYKRQKEELAAAKKSTAPPPPPPAKGDDADLAQARTALADKEKALAELPAKIRREVLGFASEATTAGFLDPEDALAFMPDDVDLSDRTAVKKALEELAERKPHLVRKSQQRATRPKPAQDEPGSDNGEEPKGKAGAVQALRQLRGGG